jgi:hypothetical protein
MAQQESINILELVKHAESIFLIYFGRNAMYVEEKSSIKWTRSRILWLSPKSQQMLHKTRCILLFFIGSYSKTSVFE